MFDEEKSVQKKTYWLPTEEVVLMYTEGRTNNVYEIKHNLNTTDINVTVYAENSNVIPPWLTVIDKNTIQVRVPDDQEYEVVIQY